MGDRSADEAGGVADVRPYGEPLGPTAASGRVLDLRRLEALDELFAGRDDLASLIEEFVTTSALLVMEQRLAEGSAEVADATLDELEDAFAEAVRVLRVAVGPDGARQEPRR